MVSFTTPVLLAKLRLWLTVKVDMHHYKKT
jgi:hypothetical protein